jgi:hypothetical protein
MKKKDKTLKWIDMEISRIKNSAFRDDYLVDGKLVRQMDPVSVRQIAALEKQKVEYLKLFDPNN